MAVTLEKSIDAVPAFCDLGNKCKQKKNSPFLKGAVSPDIRFSNRVCEKSVLSLGLLMIF
jgi:hypothetical protein